VLVAITGTAAAQSYIAGERTPPAIHRFGYRIGLGMLPLDGTPTFTFSLGLGLEHPIGAGFRALAEYEWMWTESRVPPERMTPPEYGDGHRIQLGLRHVLAHTHSFPIRVWVDGEAGGGAALVTDNIAGTHFVPDAFAGLRFGYDFRTANGESPSHTFVAEFLLRAIVIDHGAGGMFGVGMLWGD
jgi:hypothetical protein